MINRKKIFTYFFIIALAIAGNFYLYYSNSRPPSTTSSNFDFADYNIDELGAPVGSQPSSNQKFILEHELYASLRKVGDWPVIPEKIGRPDPFAPAFLD